MESITQLCAFPSPVSGSMSDMAIYRQLGSDKQGQGLGAITSRTFPPAWWKFKLHHYPISGGVDNQFLLS
jgi:hypothetical protein